MDWQELKKKSVRLYVLNVSARQLFKIEDAWVWVLSGTDNALIQLEEASKRIESESKALSAKTKIPDEKKTPKPKPSSKPVSPAHKGSSGLKFLKSARSPEMISAVNKFPDEISTSGQVPTTCNDPPRPYRMVVTCQATTYQVLYYYYCYFG